jgi:hypothetical protein
MNPEVGRFLTVDPFEGVQQEPVTLHKYLYASANPVMYVDPSGEMNFNLSGLLTTVNIVSTLGKTAVRSYEDPNYIKRSLRCQQERTYKILDCMTNLASIVGFTECFFLATCTIGCHYKSFGVLEKQCRNICFTVTTALVGWGGFVGVNSCLDEADETYNKCMGNKQQ